MEKQPPKLKKRQLTAKQLQKPNFSLGHVGEQKAISFLISHDYRILDANVRYKNHELDIIAIDCSCGDLVFIEVKTRSSSDFGSPSKAVSKKKIQSMQIVVDWYLRLHKLDQDFRFDIICVLPDTIEHYQNITW